MGTGYDVSEYQYPGAGTGSAFLIARAANGRREDYRVDGHVNAARGAGTPVSLYTYCEPGLGNPETQAQRMVAVAQRQGIRATLWADIEEGGGDLRWFEDRFVAEVNRSGYACGVYSGDYFWNAHNLVGSQGQWKAAYGSNDGRAHTAPGAPWQIWQFTSNPLDTNTAEEGVISALFGAAAPPAPAPKPVDRANSMIHVVQNDLSEKGVWIYNGVRISPEKAWGLAVAGVKSTEMLGIEFDRGLDGTVDPNNGIQDAPWFAGRLQTLRGN